MRFEQRLRKSDARKNDTRSVVQNATIVKKGGNANKVRARRSKPGNKKDFKFCCHRCKEKEHKAIDCRNKRHEDFRSSVNSIEDTLFCAMETFSNAQEAFRAEKNARGVRWCLDSGAT